MNNGYNEFAWLLYPNPGILQEARKQKNVGTPIRRGYSRYVEPPCLVNQGVPGPVYDAYRTGLDSACLDVVLTTRDARGEKFVLFGHRAAGKAFATPPDSPWMCGGAWHTYSSPEEFLARRVRAECGVEFTLEALMGFSRACAPDLPASTLQLCYVGSISINEALKARADTDHTHMGLLQHHQITAMEKSGSIHPYPALMFLEALESMPD